MTSKQNLYKKLIPLFRKLDPDNIGIYQIAYKNKVKPGLILELYSIFLREKTYTEIKPLIKEMFKNGTPIIELKEKTRLPIKEVNGHIDNYIERTWADNKGRVKDWKRQD